MKLEVVDDRDARLVCVRKKIEGRVGSYECGSASECVCVCVCLTAGFHLGPFGIPVNVSIFDVRAASFGGVS